MAPAWFSLDGDDRITGVNRAGEALLRRPRGALIGTRLWELDPAVPEVDLGPGCERARRSGQPEVFEAWAPTLRCWVEVYAVPDADALEVYLVDVTERRLAQQEAASTARRLQLLADVSDLLSHGLDQGIAVSELARLVVPDLADWCTVTLVQTGRLRQTLGWAHRDPALEEHLGRYARVQAASMSEDAAIAVCLRTGREVLVPELPPLQEWVGVDTSRTLLEVLSPRSVHVLPLAAGGRTLGAMALVRTTAGQERSEQELQTARDVARRAGLALDNARLYGEQLELATALQRSLLTEPPQVPGVQLAVRYAPAAAAAQVGGDWYDAFVHRDGAPVVVIGDVIGHDSRAAAAMGQVRGLLRGIAYATGDSPADLLADLDSAISGLGMSTSATCIVARLEAGRAGGREGGDGAGGRGATTLSWSNAGHPPPLRVGRDGAVTALEAPETDLLLGVVHGARRAEHSVQLVAGDTVLLYTDGLVERRGTSLEEGLGLLRSALAEVHASPLERLCDQLLDRLLPDQPQDDVALLALRLE